MEEQVTLKQILDVVIEIKKEVKEVKEGQKSFQQEMKAEFEQYKQEMKAEFEQYKQEMRAEFKQYKQEMREEQAELRQEFIEFTKRIEEGQERLREEMADFKANLIGSFGEWNKLFTNNMIAHREAISADFRKFKHEIYDWAKEDIVFYLNEREKKIEERLQTLEIKMA